MLNYSHLESLQSPSKQRKSILMQYTHKYCKIYGSLCAQRKFAAFVWLLHQRRHQQKQQRKHLFRVFRTRFLFLFSIKTISNGLFKFFPHDLWPMIQLLLHIFAQLIFLEDIHVRFDFKCLNIPHRNAHHKFMWLCAIHVRHDVTFQRKLFFKKTKKKQFKMITLKENYIFFTIIIGTRTAHWLHSNK